MPVINTSFDGINAETYRPYSHRTQTIQGAERQVQQVHHPKRPGSLLPGRQGQRRAEEQDTWCTFCRYVSVFFCIKYAAANQHSSLPVSSCRKWRNPKPITSFCCSVTPGASSGPCTPTARRRRRSPNWPASGRRASPSRWSRACTSTTRTGSSSAWSRPKRCPPAWTPSPSPATCGKPRSRPRPKNCTPSSTNVAGRARCGLSGKNTGGEFVYFTFFFIRRTRGAAAINHNWNVEHKWVP